MKTSALHIFGISALLAAVTACSGPAAPQANETSSPASTTVQSATPSATPSPTPTASAKAYTSDDLAAIVRQLRDSADRRLNAVPGTDLTATLQQTKDMISSIDVQPAECKELAASSSIPSLDGAAMALGVSTDTTTGAATALSLLSGLDQATLAKVRDQSGQLEKCSEMTMSVQGMQVSVTITALDGVGSAADTTAYRTDSNLPDGRVQSIITAQAVRQGVVVTAVASGGTEADATGRAGALLDSAAALIK